MSELSELIARATSLVNEAERLANVIAPSNVNDQVTVVASTVRKAHADLREMLAGEREIELSSIEAVLDEARTKLEAIERWQQGEGRRTHAGGRPS